MLLLLLLLQRVKHHIQQEQLRRARRIAQKTARIRTIRQSRSLGCSFSPQMLYLRLPLNKAKLKRVALCVILLK